MHNATARFGQIDLPERSPRDGLTTVITEEVAYCTRFNQVLEKIRVPKPGPGSARNPTDGVLSSGVVTGRADSVPAVQELGVALVRFGGEEFGHR
ncbi:hypothetical protein [Streptomyces europaeiscabiei]|uniref:hypothetical protein n=1 Tax=Streptomyces europaeiscabiei TaxID=146819 RepID=UPI002E149E07|nr:hypothetical protein OHB30_45925 [Streptomyces europaeiscabiei]